MLRSYKWIGYGLGLGWDLCGGLFYEHHFAVLIKGHCFGHFSAPNLVLAALLASIVFRHVWSLYMPLHCEATNWLDSVGIFVNLTLAEVLMVFPHSAWFINPFEVERRYWKVLATINQLAVLFHVIGQFANGGKLIFGIRPRNPSYPIHPLRPQTISICSNNCQLTIGTNIWQCPSLSITPFPFSLFILICPSEPNAAWFNVLLYKTTSEM